MLVISTYGNSAFRSEELEGIFRMKNTETNRITKSVGLQFKSGSQITIDCKTLKEAKEFFDTVVEIMKKDYNSLIK